MLRRSVATRVPTGGRGRSARVVVLSLGLIGAVSPRLAFAQSEQQAVLAVEKRFFDGMRARDTAMMRSTVDPMTMVVIPSGPPGFEHPIPISQFISDVGKGTGPGGDEQITNPTVQIDGPLASTWAYYTYKEGGQTKIHHCGTDLFLFQKEPTGWRIYHISGTIRMTGCTPIGK